MSRLLLDVEKYDNPIEIVIHVNMLKEGWDVDNLYTIIPLRTAASKVLREQMVGRGLRLPYGERTGDKEVDSVTLTAHAAFGDILKEAEKGEGIFNRGNIIDAAAEGVTQVVVQQYALPFGQKDVEAAYTETGLEDNDENGKLLTKLLDATRTAVAAHIRGEGEGGTFTDADGARIAAEVKRIVESSAEGGNAENGGASSDGDGVDMARVVAANDGPLLEWLPQQAKRVYHQIESNFIPIPHIKMTVTGEPIVKYGGFDIDLTPFNHTSADNRNAPQVYGCPNMIDLYDNYKETYEGSIKSVVFSGTSAP